MKGKVTGDALFVVKMKARTSSVKEIARNVCASRQRLSYLVQWSCNELVGLKRFGSGYATSVDWRRTVQYPKFVDFNGRALL